MANHKSSEKRIRANETKKIRNHYQAQTARNAIKKLSAVKDKKTASEGLPEIVSMIDKLAKRDIIHKEKAANLKSKLAKRINSL